MTTFFKKVALIGALALTFGVSAQAATNSLGTISGTTTVSTLTSSGSFDDLITFTVSANAGSALVSSAVTFSSYGASLTSLALYSTIVSSTAGLTPIAASTSTVTTNLGGGIVVDSVSGKTPTLAAGTSYTLEVKGTSQGSSAYTTIIALAPVPEPETYAMLLAGLGVMGFVARRRQKNNQA